MLRSNPANQSAGQKSPSRKCDVGFLPVISTGRNPPYAQAARRDSVGACHVLPMLGMNRAQAGIARILAGRHKTGDTETGPDGTGGRGHIGHHPYMESICCRLQQTTSVEYGAHGAQSCQLIEPGGLGVGSIEIHTVPMAAHASKWGLDSSWTPATTFWRAGER